MHPRAPRLAVAVSLAVALLMGSVGSALATVTFDPATGVGYVDKADVQAIFGWKEGTFQANARRLGFHAASYTSWTWDCLIDGQLTTLSADLESSWAVDSEVVSTSGHRRSAQGFNLTGLGVPLSSPPSGSPVSCPQGDPSNAGSSATDVLYVDLRGQSEVLWTS